MNGVLYWENASPRPHKSITTQLLAEVRLRGLGIVLWREERPAELRQLVELGIDAIPTNGPDILTALLREQKGKP